MRRADIDARLQDHGLVVVGLCGLSPDDDFPPGSSERRRLKSAQSIALVGPNGKAFWTAFSATPEARDGAPDPIDRWSRRIGADIAAELGARPLDPSSTKPAWPFLAWARRSNEAWPSPLGMLVHAELGLWLSFRFALAFDGPVSDGVERTARRPCDRCVARSCVGACPVDAFEPGGFKADRCRDHLRSTGGAACMERGCMARAACPVGADAAPQPERARLHMRAFRDAGGARA